MSPEVLTNSWLLVLFDIPKRRQGIVNISLIEGARTSVSGHAKDLGLSLNHTRGSPALLREESKKPQERAEEKEKPQKNNGIMLIMVGLTLALIYYLPPIIDFLN